MTQSPADQPAGTPRVRLVALGDDMLAGVGDAKALGWLGRALARHNDGQARVDAFTAARPLETTAQLADRWQADLERLIDQDPESRTEHRVVISLGAADIGAGVSLARSRLNLATVLDGLERYKFPTFVVGPAPSVDRGRTNAIFELSGAFHDVCARRRIPYVDPVAALMDHEQYMGDLARSDRDMPSQVGYGLIAWLVLHSDFSAFLQPR